MSSYTIDWSDVIKKEARGSGDEDLGGYKKWGKNYVVIRREMVNKEKFYIPIDMAESNDGDVLRFSIYENDGKSKN
jgi:hypothetical protein